MEAPSTPPRRDLSPPRAGGTPAIRAADLTVAKFAQLLGTSASSGGDFSRPTGGGGNGTGSDRSKALLSLFSNHVTDDDVVLVLPSLAMRLSDSKAALPSIGETQGSSSSPTTPQEAVGPPPQPDVGGGDSSSRTPPTSGAAANTSSGTRPRMAASVLTAASNDAAEVEQRAATSVSKQTSWTRSTVVYASQAVASNSSEFFTNLIDSRLRSWTLLLLRHSLSTGNQESRARLMNMLSATVIVEKTETKFKTLTLPEVARSQPKEADVILPLLLEIALTISLKDQNETVTLRAPGTISAYMANEKLRKVIIRLDTGVLLSTMVDQARLVVFKAVASATKLAIPDSSTSPGVGTKFTVSTKVDDPTSTDPSTDDGATKKSLSGFRSAMNLSTPQSDLSPSLQKARSSALKLNSVLYGTSGSGNKNGGQTLGGSAGPTLGERRNRSIRWDTPLQLPTIKSHNDPAPDPKKLRMAENAAKLKSFKSFGRPHAGVFGSGPRNATFGEYNRAHLWGRDGRMAHHPVPMLSAAQSQLDGAPEAPDKNATFDFSNASKSTSRPGGSGSPVAGASLSRTATVLERMLMKSTGSK